MPLLVESTITHLTVKVSIPSFACSPQRKKVSPAILTRDIENLQIQPPETKIPLSRMTIRALVICTPAFPLKRDVPAPASLIGNQGQGQTVVLSNLLDELRITFNGPEPVGDGQG